MHSESAPNTRNVDRRNNSNHRVRVILDSRSFYRVYKRSPIYKGDCSMASPPIPRKEVLYVEDSLRICHSTNDGGIDACNG